jgi:hypothetical protein
MDFFKLFSAKSIAIGLVVAIGLIAFLWPVNAFGTPIAIMGFCIGAGVSELVRRIRGGAPNPPQSGAVSDKAAADAARNAE